MNGDGEIEELTANEVPLYLFRSSTTATIVPKVVSALTSADIGIYVSIESTEFPTSQVGLPYVSPTDIPAYLAASKAMETTYGKKPVPVKSGGSIPIVALFEKELGVKSILLGFGLDSDAIHSPNEHYGIFNYLKGIETIPHFFTNFVKMKLQQNK